MKKNIIIGLTAIVICLMSAACSNNTGDPEIESQLDGTWKATHTETEYEDGVAIRMKATETVSYDAKTHKMHSVINMRMTSPISIDFCTITVDGTWSADVNSLSENYDRSSVKFDFNTGLLDREDREEFKSEMLSDFENKSVCEIRAIETDRIVVYDGEDELTYHRKQ